MRKVIIIIVVALLVVAGVLAYLFFRQVGVPAGSTTGQTGSLPGATVSGGSTLNSFVSGSSSTNAVSRAGALNIIDPGPVFSYFVNKSGTAILVRPDGSIGQIIDGQFESLASTTIANLISATFSYDGQKIVVSSGDVQNPQVSIFDVSSRLWTSLSMGILSPVWAPSGYQLAYLRDNGGGEESLSLITIGKSKMSQVTLGNFYIQDMALSWPSANIIVLSGRPSAYVDSPIFLFNIQSKAFSPFIFGQSGSYAMFGGSPLTGLAFSVGVGQRGGHLQLVSATGTVLNTLSFLTLLSKCVFAQGFISVPVASSSSTMSGSSTISQTASSSITNNPLSTTFLYCAVPRDQTTLSYYPLPDAYTEGSISTEDNIYQINITTGIVDTLFSGASQNFDVMNPGVFNNTFYFIDRYTQALYGIVLP